MCTALTLNNKKTFLFGRNMDIETSFGQKVVITPRNFVIPLRFQKHIKQKYALIGMASPMKDVENNNIDYPLYAEAANEKGLAVAGLNFPATAYYPKPGEIKGAFELTPYEVIPYLLSQFTTTNEVRDFFKKNNVQIVHKPFSQNIPVAPLHFIVSDKTEDCMVIEPCEDGLKVYENTLGILTNNPTFDWQKINLSFYQNIKSKQSDDVEWLGEKLDPFGQGFGSVGLPGDWTPPARFVRTSYLKLSSPNEEDKNKLITQFFHVLDNVAMVKGSIIVDTPKGEKFDITLYSSCIDLNEGIYYYKSYDNNQINIVKLHNENLDGDKIIVYPFSTEQSFFEVNKK